MTREEIWEKLKTEVKLRGYSPLTMLLKYNNKNVYRFDAEAIAKEADAARQQAEQKED